MRGFGSDNHSGVHPEILQALSGANIDHAPSYGTDPLTEKCQEMFKTFFGKTCEAYFVFNGTASNVLSLKAMMKSHESCLVSDISHMNLDECGAPEFFAGKLIPVKSVEGKLTLPELEKHLIRLGDQHYTQPRVVSLTQPTEVGTLYSLEEIKTISTWAKKHNLLVHMDGARFTNAVYKLNCSMQAMTTDLGIDVLSFGGTKNGLMFGEAVVILNPALGKDFKYIRKQAAQLPSKTRFIAAQFLAFFSNELYLKIAKHSCDMAQYFFETLSGKLKINYPVQSNALFAVIPQPLVKKLKQKYFFYVWNETIFECRLMTSWDTQKSDIEGFCQALDEIL
ncbi:threonine aldolase [Bdellovibrio sp. qaytius]|nr:threonine aldolase [Bdellovibrio sp. qaytius]